MEDVIEIIIKIQEQIDYLYSENCIVGDDWMNEVCDEVRTKLKKLKQEIKPS
jgi:hypothetical protein